jgi:hypothetical protein
MTSVTGMSHEAFRNGRDTPGMTLRCTSRESESQARGGAPKDEFTRRELLPTRAELLVLEQARNQHLKFLVRQRRKLREAGIQSRELALGHRVEVDPTNELLGTRALQPTEEDLGSTRIRDSALTQAAFDGGIRGRLPVTTCCALPA